MVKASSQIEKELGLLQQRTEDMANALDPLYGSYLKALGEASKQQLMAAVYHLCTQAYPDKFLKLSWQQRNNLQKSLQVLAAQIHTQLSEQREQVKKNSRKPQRNNGLEFLQRLLAARASGAVIHTKEGSSDDLLDKLSEIARFESSPNRAPENEAGTLIDDSDLTEASDLASDSALPDGAEGADDSWHNEVAAAEDDHDDGLDDGLNVADFESFSLDLDDSLAALDPTDDVLLGDGDRDGRTADSEALDFEVDVPAAEQRLTLSEEDDLLGALEALARRSNPEEEEPAGDEKPLSPFHLIKQQMLMEKAIREVFKTVSEEANNLLQKADVMPNFPKALMAAAAETRGPGELANAVPNVVKVSVRVMHGTANFDLDDDDANEFSDGREPGQQSRIRKLGPRGRRPLEGDDRHGKGKPRDNTKENNPDNLREDARESRRRLNSNRSKDDFSDRYRDNRRASYREERADDFRREGPPRRFLPPDAVEIEAFPEFAAINLQLSEVEFTDPRVSVWRSRLRQELANLKQLGLRYRKTQRSLETAQAEDAWRASWTSQEES